MIKKQNLVSFIIWDIYHWQCLQVVLTAFVGNDVALVVTVRPVASLVQDNAYQFTAISNFSILDSKSSNCVGGQSIPSSLALN